MAVTNLNQFPGLARGPIDHESSSVINSISGGTIDMGSVVALDTTFTTGDLLPEVKELGVQGSIDGYGIAVGGDVDGIYGDGSAASDDKTKATNDQGQGVVVVTRGRCLARVITPTDTAIVKGQKLTMSATLGVLEVAATGDWVIATALQGIPSAGAGNEALNMIAVEVNKEGQPD